MTFTTQTMQQIIPYLQEKLKSHKSVIFNILNPDYTTQSYAGELVTVDTQTYIYRGYKAWSDLAELLGCKLCTPKAVEHSPLVEMTFLKLADDSFHHDSQDEEKYGASSRFAQIHKMEEPAFLYYFQQALQNVTIAHKKRVLNLGINRGDEFEVIKNMIDAETYESMELTGIDYSKSAIAEAKTKFPEPNVSFYTHNINDLKSLNLGKFDLLISIGTLQSPGIHYKPFLMELVQEHLTQDAALILGFPNSRWIDGEMVYGAKAPNYAMSEMSLLFNDVMFAKKYLQQKKFRVTITGKQYIFLTATKIGVKLS